MPDALPQSWTIPQRIADAVAGDRGQLARLLTDLERAGATSAQASAGLSGHLTGVGVIGLTGPPGAGKSTLVDALVRVFREQALRIAIIAVDPSSPVSGGAILGDRVRMSAAISDDGIFVRSLSASGHTGGIAPAAVRMIDAFDAAGYDRVIIETVGTGQSEIDIAEIADVRVVVAAPGLGDDVQAMKSGLLEIADLMVVTKADRPGAAETRQQLMGAQSLRTGRDGDAQGVPVLMVSSVTREGIGALSDAIAEALPDDRSVHAMHARRKRRARYLLVTECKRLVELSLKSPAAGVDVDAIAGDLMSGAITPQQALRKIIKD